MQLTLGDPAAFSLNLSPKTCLVPGMIHSRKLRLRVLGNHYPTNWLKNGYFLLLSYIYLVLNKIVSYFVDESKSEIKY